MKISDKIDTINPKTLSTEINSLVDNAKISISWFGQRIITVNGYEGSATIDQLATKYLDATRGFYISNPSFQERLSCKHLWGRIKMLYDQSDDILNKTWAYKFFVWILEFRPFGLFSERPRSRIISSKDAKDIFRFPLDKFKEYWPIEFEKQLELDRERMEEVRRRSPFIFIRGALCFYASEEMLQTALSQKV